MIGRFPRCCGKCGAPLDAPKRFSRSCGQSLVGGEASASTGAIRPPNTGRRRPSLVMAFIVLGAAAVVAIAVRALAPASTSSPAATYYKTLAEVRAMRGNAVDIPLRVEGTVARGSIQRNGRNVRFVLYADALQMQVVYVNADPLRGAFREASTVLVSGRLGRDDVFHASRVSVVEIEPWLPPKPELFIRADDLFDQYQQNEVKADQLYRGHYLEVYGHVSRVGKDILDNAYISFRVGSPVLAVRCAFSQTPPPWVRDVGPGTSISVVCKGMGKSMDVILGDCRAGGIGFTANTGPDKQP